MRRMFVFRVLFGVVAQPFQSPQVRQVLHLKMIEGCPEPFPVRAGSHRAHHDRRVVLQPGVAHQRVLLVVERIEDLDGVEPPHGLDPDAGYGLLQRDDAPVGGVVGHHGAEVVLSVHEFDARLDVVFVVDAQHQAGLVEPFAVLSRDPDLGLELSAVGGIIEGSVVYGEPIVRDSPVVALRGDEE